MSLSDPLGDMLARIKNGQLRKKESVVMPHQDLEVMFLMYCIERGI